MLNVYADYSSAQTATALIAAPSTNRAIRVWNVVVMSDTAGAVTFLSGTANTEIFKGYPAANGGFNVPAPVLPETQNFGLFQAATAEPLDFTSDIAGNHSVHVIYEIVKTG